MAAQNPGLPRHVIFKMLTIAASIYENMLGEMLGHKRAFNILFRSEFDLYSQFTFITFMKKLWLLFALVVIVASQVAVLSSFHSINYYTWANGPTAVVISKAAYAQLRVEIDIIPQVNNGLSNTTLIFPNGTQIEIPAVAHYKFSVILPSSGPSPGSFGIQFEGINISDNHPIDVEFLSNSTAFQSVLSQYQLNDQQIFSRFSVYWFLVQGNAMVSIQGYGVGF